MWLNIKKNIFINTVIFLLLIQPCAYPQIDTNFLRTFFSKVGELPWQVDIDSMVSLLAELGVDTCSVTGKNNHYTVGPSVRCKTGHTYLGIGYRWNKTFFPNLDFFVLHASNCDTCLQYFDLLRQFNYADYIGSAPKEVQKLFRDFKYGDSCKIRIEAWNECCPGNRIKLYRTVYTYPRKNINNLNESRKCRRSEEFGGKEKAAAKK